jgi:hypothetical protein
MKTTLFLINAALCLTIGVSLASDPLPEDVNNKQIIPRLTPQALNNYASTYKTNYIAVRAYKDKNGIDDKLVLIHCPSSTEMISILKIDRDIANICSNTFKDPHTGMGWSFGNSKTDTLIGQLHGSKLVRIYISKDKLECEYIKRGEEFPIFCERPLKTSKSALILTTGAPSNPKVQVTGDIILQDESHPLVIDLNAGTIQPAYTTTHEALKLLPKDAKEGLDIVFNQTKCTESSTPSA